MDKPIPRGRAADSAGNRWRESVLVSIVLGITLLTYLGTLTFDFVYDDQAQIVQNPFVRSWRHVPGYFSSHAWENLYPHMAGNYYRPFLLLWLRLNYVLFAVRPMGWHFTTVLLHVAATWLVYALVRRLTANPLTAVVAALLFGVHPVHVEVAAWVLAAADSLYTIALLGAFLAYLQARQKNAAAWRVASLGLFVAALLCKETAIVLPVLILAHAWIYARSEGAPERPPARVRLWNAARLVAPYLVVAGAYLIVRSVVLKGLGQATVKLTLPTILLTWPYVLFFYLKSLLYPVGLSGFYDTPYVRQFSVRQVLLPLLAVLAVAAGIWYWQRRTRSADVKFAAVWLLVPLLPILNLAALPENDYAHDRYLYLPSLGFVFLLALGLQAVVSSRPERLSHDSRLALATLAITALLCLATAVQSRHWENDYALYSHGHKVAPRNATAANNLATVHLERGELGEAMELYMAVLREQPNCWPANVNLGRLLYQLGNLSAAEKHLLRAIEVYPYDAEEHSHLAMVRFRMGRVSEAIAGMRRAVALKPEGKGYHFALGVMLMQDGNCAEARPEFQAELRLNPGNEKVRQHLEKCNRLASAK